MTSLTKKNNTVLEPHYNVEMGVVPKTVDKESIDKSIERMKAIIRENKKIEKDLLKK